jgi:hypothetical protein
MNDERQITIPATFLQLYQDPRHGRLTAARPWLEERHELCEDFSQLLAEQVRQKILELRITQFDALERVARGLDAEPAPLGLSSAEIGWVKTRLHELLQHA